MINKENINTEEAKRMNAFSGKQFSQNIKIEEEKNQDTEDTDSALRTATSLKHTEEKKWCW